MMLRLLEDWRAPAWSLRPRRIQQGVEMALALLLVVQAARLIWLVAAPTAAADGSVRPVRPTAAVDLSVLERFDPFFRGQPSGGSLAASESGGQGGLVLFGVRSDGRGGGSAIVGTPDGAQASYMIGETLGGGYILRAVGPDHVVLSRGGGRTKLSFDTNAAPPPPPPVAAAAQPAASTVLPASTPSGPASDAPTLDPKRFMSAVAMTPQLKGGRIAGYRVMSRGGGGALSAAGLQDGDVVTAVDGSPLSPERLTELPGLLAGATSDVEVRFERDGQPMTTRLRTVSR